MNGYWARVRELDRYTGVRDYGDWIDFLTYVMRFKHIRKNGRLSIRRVYDRYKKEVEDWVIKERLKNG